MIGIVTNNNDPDTMGRVKLSLPVAVPGVRVGLGAGGPARARARSGARASCPRWATRCWSAFEFGDVRRPYVLGGLFNGKSEHPMVSGAVKTQGPLAQVVKHGIVSRLGNQIVFEDDEPMPDSPPPSVTASSITISDKDGKVKVVLDKKSGEITILCDSTLPPAKINIEQKGTGGSITRGLRRRHHHRGQGARASSTLKGGLGVEIDRWGTGRRQDRRQAHHRAELIGRAAVHADFVGAGWALPAPARPPTAASPWCGASASSKRPCRSSCSTYPGERPMRPEFGSRIRDFVFTGIDTGTLALLGEEVRQSLRRWEPRVDVVKVRLTLDEADPQLRAIGIEYQVKGTNDRRNLVFPFYTIPDDGSRRTDHDAARPQPRRPPLPGAGGRRQAPRAGTVPGVDRPQRVRSRASRSSRRSPT